jgi:hypothetical protein
MELETKALGRTSFAQLKKRLEAATAAYAEVDAFIVTRTGSGTETTEPS